MARVADEHERTLLHFAVGSRCREVAPLAVLRKLVEGADVFVQNFRPGVVDRMGIGEADMRALKPDLVYVSISGYGEDGPYAQRRVYDSVMQAISGTAAHQANSPHHAVGGPSRGGGIPSKNHKKLCGKNVGLFSGTFLLVAPGKNFGSAQGPPCGRSALRAL